MDFLISSAFAANEVKDTVATTAVAPTPDPVAVPYEISPDKMLRDNLLLLAGLFFIFFFVLIRPQQKRIKQHNEMIKALSKGSKVITSGGIIGTVIKVENDIVVVEIAQSVRVRVAKSAISEVTDDKATSDNANDN